MFGKEIEMMDYLKNGWNWVHLFGSCCLALLLYRMMFNEDAFILAFCLGVLWEGLDAANKRYGWKLCLLDENGFDFRDVVMDLIGVIMAMLIIGGMYAG